MGEIRWQPPGQFVTTTNHAIAGDGDNNFKTSFGNHGVHRHERLAHPTPANTNLQGRGSTPDGSLPFQSPRLHAMILLLDVGNTRVKWAWLEYLEVAPAGAVAHDSTHRAWQREIESDGHRPSRVVVSNVAGPAFAAALTLWCRAHYSVDPEFVVATGALLGVRNGYRRPATLGVDRWLALIAAWRRSPKPTLIVNSGTALTIDTLDRTGQHRGGLILPGLSMLGEVRAGLALEPDAPAATASNLGDPLALMLAAAAEQAWRELGETLGTPPDLLLTGGDAKSLVQHFGTPAQFVPDLVLNGLAAVATNGTARA